MKQEIDTLMDLQSIDREIQILDKQIASGQGELDNRKASIEKNKTSIAEFKERLKTGEQRQREIEAEIEDENAKLKDRQTKLMSVQTNREYQSILKETEDTKQQNKQREEELLLLIEQTESIKTKISELTALCESEETELQEETATIATKAKDLEAQKSKIQKDRDKQAKKVNSKFLKRYEMLRQKRNGLAMAGVTNGVCKGCNMNIPPQLFNNLLREDEILSCPTCNRMMYHLPVVEKAS